MSAGYAASSATSRRNSWSYSASVSSGASSSWYSRFARSTCSTSVGVAGLGRVMLERGGLVDERGIDGERLGHAIPNGRGRGDVLADRQRRGGSRRGRVADVDHGGDGLAHEVIDQLAVPRQRLAANAPRAQHAGGLPPSAGTYL